MVFGKRNMETGDCRAGQTLPKRFAAQCWLFLCVLHVADEGAMRLWRWRGFGVGKGFGDFFVVTPWFGFQFQTYGTDVCTLSYEVGVRVMGRKAKDSAHSRNILWQNIVKIPEAGLYAN